MEHKCDNENLLHLIRISEFSKHDDEFEISWIKDVLFQKITPTPDNSNTETIL